MRPQRATQRLMVAFLVSLAAACGLDAVEASGDTVASARAALMPEDAWVPAPPGDLAQVQWGGTVELRGCTYAVGSIRELPPLPPLYWAFVYRSGQGRHCASGYSVLGSSYARPSVAIAAGFGQLVADYTVRYTPSGEAHWHLFLVELSPATGQVLRRWGLSAMAPSSGTPNLGNVFDGALEVRPAGGLVVTGSKNGLIPGEEGEGLNYRAEYRHLLVGLEDVPPTVHVTAW